MPRYTNCGEVGSDHDVDFTTAIKEESTAIGHCLIPLEVVSLEVPLAMIWQEPFHERYTGGKSVMGGTSRAMRFHIVKVGPH